MTRIAKLAIIIRNALILSVLIGVTFIGWAWGHTMRYSIPTYQPASDPQYWIPPTHENEIKTLNASEFNLEGEFVFVITLDSIQTRTDFSGAPSYLQSQCLGNTFYTSLPAKCQGFDGKLFPIGNTQGQVYQYIP